MQQIWHLSQSRENICLDSLISAVRFLLKRVETVVIAVQPLLGLQSPHSVRCCVNKTGAKNHIARTPNSRIIGNILNNPTLHELAGKHMWNAINGSLSECLSERPGLQPFECCDQFTLQSGYQCCYGDRKKRKEQQHGEKLPDQVPSDY